MRALLIVVALSGCSVPPAHYWRDDRGQCHAIRQDGVLFYDIACPWKRSAPRSGAGEGRPVAELVTAPAADLSQEHTGAEDS